MPRPQRHAPAGVTMHPSFYLARCATLTRCARPVLAALGLTVAAVTAHAAVGVDDNFPPGQTGITLGSADDEITGGVDEELGGFGQHALRQDFFDDFLDAEFLDFGVGFAGGVLGGDDDVDDV